MTKGLWDRCLVQLQERLTSEQYNTWLRPLQAKVLEESGQLFLYAPNMFVMDWVKTQYLQHIDDSLQELYPGTDYQVNLRVGSLETVRKAPATANDTNVEDTVSSIPSIASKTTKQGKNLSTENSEQSLTLNAKPVVVNFDSSNLNSFHTFDNFVVGKSNEMAYAASQYAANNPGKAYNPLLIYGGVGLGKTHLMQSIGNEILKQKPHARVVYMHSERFYGDMVAALRNKTIDEFKRYYRSIDALLVDDIQFFAGKEKTQEEFFHTFNSLVENGQHIVLTCDKLPRELDGIDERLKSRFGWGLTVGIDAPDMETRAAILTKKAIQANIHLPNEVATFIAQRIQSNVRELEGILQRVIAHVRFTGKPVDLGLVKEALKDVLAMQARLVSVDNIQQVVAEYYKLRISDLLSPQRTRSIARPRQVAMALSKELTSMSLPEIGSAFGGKDHTTVLHACRKIAELRNSAPDIERDYQNLLRNLTT